MNGTVSLVKFRIEGNRYAFLLSTVVRVVRAVAVTPLPKAPRVVIGIIDVEGSIMPVISLRRRFNLGEREIVPEDCFILADMPNNQLSESGQRPVAIVVDGVEGVIEIPAEQISPAKAIAAEVDYVAGVVAVGGGLVVIHDLGRCLSIDEARTTESALETFSRNG